MPNGSRSFFRTGVWMLYSRALLVGHDARRKCRKTGHSWWRQCPFTYARMYSFVPPPEIRELRLLLRHRVSLLEQRNEVHNQIRDLFETANVKLSSVVSDLLPLVALFQQRHAVTQQQTQ